MAMTAPPDARLAITAALLLSLPACGVEQSAPADEGSARSSASINETLLSCGGQQPGWPVSAMDGGIDSRFTADDLTVALTALAKEAGIDAPPALQNVVIEQARWFVLAETSNTVTVATGAWDKNGPGTDAQIVNLERVGARWMARGW